MPMSCCNAALRQAATNFELSRDPTRSACVSHRSRTGLRLKTISAASYAARLRVRVKSTVLKPSLRFFQRVRAKIGEADEESAFSKNDFCRFVRGTSMHCRFPNRASDAPARKAPLSGLLATVAI